MATETQSHFQWPAIFGGAAVAAGVSLTLNAFGAGIGLAAVSSDPSWREASSVTWLVGGAFLLFVSIISFAVGGYVSARMRERLSLDGAESEFRDGMHGLATWGVAIAFGALLALGAALAAKPAASSTTAAQSSAAETLLAAELDTLFRTGRVIDDLSYRRAEAGRILLTANGKNGVSNPDRRYLTTITGIVLNVPETEATARVNDAITHARDALHRARVAAVLQAFFVAAALLVGAVIAWHAATEGGKDRETGDHHFWNFAPRRRA